MLIHFLVPVLAAAFAVFVAGSLIHMVFRWHNSDFSGLENEAAIRALRRAGSPPPGQYVIPSCKQIKEMGSAPMQAKYREGPIGFLTLRPAGVPTIGTNLAQWFALNLLVAVLAAHRVALAIGSGAGGHRIFHEAALVTFIGYAAGSIGSGIWKGQPWKSVAKDVLDARIYGPATGSVFVGLWPR